MQLGSLLNPELVKSSGLFQQSTSCQTLCFVLQDGLKRLKSSVGEDDAMMKLSQDIGEMWLRLVNNLKRVCLDQRDQVRNHAILMMRRSIAGADGIMLPQPLWFQCFDSAIFPLLDELLAFSIENSKKNFKKTVEETLVLATNS